MESITFFLLALISLCFVAFFIWLKVIILHKAGYSGWWAATFYIPILNVIMLWVFAYADWPNVRARRVVPLR